MSILSSNISPWKLQSKSRLSTKINRSRQQNSNASIDNILILDQQQRQLSSPKKLMGKLSSRSKIQSTDILELSDSSPTKRSTTSKIKQFKKKYQQRQQVYKNKTLIKMKYQVQDENVNLKKQYDQKYKKWEKINEEYLKVKQISMRMQQKSQQRNNKEEIIEQRMRKMSNLQCYHNEIIDSFKKDILQQKKTKQDYFEKIKRMKEQIKQQQIKYRRSTDLTTKILKMKEKKQQLSFEKTQLQRKQKILRQSKQEIIRNGIFNLIQSNKQQIQKYLQKVNSIIKQCERRSSSKKQFIDFLLSFGIKRSDYYTYQDIKLDPQMNYTKNKDNEEIFTFLQDLIQIPISEGISVEDTKPMKQIKGKLKGIEEKRLKLHQVLVKLELEVQQKQLRKANIHNKITEIQNKIQDDKIF